MHDLNEGIMAYLRGQRICEKQRGRSRRRNDPAKRLTEGRRYSAQPTRDLDQDADLHSLPEKIAEPEDIEVRRLIMAEVESQENRRFYGLPSDENE